MSGDTVVDDNPAANATAAWKSMEDDWSKKSSKPPTLRYVAVMILGWVFEGARRRRALERRIEVLELQIASSLRADEDE